MVNAINYTKTNLFLYFQHYCSVLVSGSPGVSSTDYYSTNPYTQYSNSYGVAYNYPAPSPASAGPGGLLSK